MAAKGLFRWPNLDDCCNSVDSLLVPFCQAIYCDNSQTLIKSGLGKGGLILMTWLVALSPPDQKKTGKERQMSHKKDKLNGLSSVLTVTRFCYIMKIGYNSGKLKQGNVCVWSS